MRLFTALELNSKVVSNLTELVRRMGPVAPIRWVNPQNMNVTLKYVGEWPAGRLETLVRALNEVRLTHPLTVNLAGLGFYPNAARPRVFWIGAENTPPLRQLTSLIDAQLQPLGIAPEVRPYQPRITLGSLDEWDAIDELHEVVEDLPSREFGTLNPDRFVLYENTLTDSGSIFRKVADFPLLSPAAASPEPNLAAAQAAGLVGASAVR